MGLGSIGRHIAAKVGRTIGKNLRKYVAPALPVIVTPVAIGAGLSAAALALFFHIADDVRAEEGVWRFDHDGLKLGLELRNPRRTVLMQTASALARPDIMTYIGGIAILGAWRIPKYRPQCILLAVSLTGGGVMIGGMKTKYERARPTLIDALAQEGTFSFPSGHSFISLCFYGILTYWWFRARKEFLPRAAVLLASGSGIMLIGASRVYLGVHYPSDVLAGYAAAVPWLTACLTAYHQYEKRVNAHLLPAPPEFEFDEEETEILTAKTPRTPRWEGEEKGIKALRSVH